MCCELGHQVLDVHVETRKGEVTFLDDTRKFATSILPAIALVLSILLGGVDAIEWDWSRLETTAALGEMMLLL
jgi:hypothetical protein